MEGLLYSFIYWLSGYYGILLYLFSPVSILSILSTLYSVIISLSLSYPLLCLYFIFYLYNTPYISVCVIPIPSILHFFSLSLSLYSHLFLFLIPFYSLLLYILLYSRSSSYPRFSSRLPFSPNATPAPNLLPSLSLSLFFRLSLFY